MPHDITVGVDGTPASLAAAHWAAQEAQRRGTGLTVVHAWHPHLRPAAHVPADSTEHRWAEAVLGQAVRGLRAAHPGLRVTERLVCDSAVGVLVAAAADSELLVLGSLGLGALGGFVTGSVSQRVVARSPRPVVLVRAGRGIASDHLPAVDGIAPDEIPRTPYREVVLGLDIGQPCDEVVEFAFDAARRRGTGLQVVHAVRPPVRPVSDASLVVAPPAAGRLEPAPDAESAPQARALAEAEHTVAAVVRTWRGKFPTVPVTGSVTEGRAAAALLAAARDAGLLVVGRRESGHRIGTQLGPVAHAALHHAGCPVAVVPHG
ncbi:MULTISPECIES: universal stress protein [Streptomyces]|uniref:universal stress protein n=1 Tax=Streptomyces TaxID=1883 RepID=UPI001408BFF6|nr:MULTISPECIES: universal stress protein [Streptomyces]MDH6229006.1 nucleotide-binding universal stress UspA family protein [Streptomyces sp. MJP52]